MRGAMRSGKQLLLLAGLGSALIFAACGDVDPLPDRLFVTHYYTDALRSVDVETGDVGTLGVTLPPGKGLVDDVYGYLYWPEGTTIRRANLTSGVVSTLVINLDDPLDVAYDPVWDKLYWSDNGTGTIARSNLDGSGIETVVSGLTDPLFVAVDGRHGYLYWSDRTEGVIYRATLAGTSAEVVAGVTSPGNPDPDVPGGHHYWMEHETTSPTSGTDTVYRADLGGQNAVPIKVIDNNGIEISVGIAADRGGKGVYFSDNVGFRIGHVKPDGSGERDVVTIDRPANLELAR